MDERYSWLIASAPINRGPRNVDEVEYYSSKASFESSMWPPTSEWECCDADCDDTLVISILSVDDSLYIYDADKDDCSVGGPDGTSMDYMDCSEDLSHLIPVSPQRPGTPDSDSSV